jgi:cobalt/nickel transport system ATP-binding protein
MTPALEVDGLSFAFDDVPVLQGLHFRVQDGERVGIVGSNGAGKSTLLWCLLGLLEGKGQIRVLGRPQTVAGSTAVGAVFQNPEDQLFMPRLIDDLTLPLVNQGMALVEATARAEATLNSLGLGFAAARPAARLSLGERKRAALAAVLVTQPQMIVLDEPTAELDGRSVRQLVTLLNGLTFTLLVASHDLDFLRLVTSRVLILIDGRLVADGPAASLLTDLPLLERAGLI